MEPRWVVKTSLTHMVSKDKVLNTFDLCGVWACVQARSFALDVCDTLHGCSLLLRTELLPGCRVWPAHRLTARERQNFVETERLGEILFPPGDTSLDRSPPLQRNLCCRSCYW